MKYFIANLFVASIMALAFVGFAKADGVDDPKFYQEQERSYGQIFDYCMASKFNNQSTRCRQYDDMGPFNWPPEIIDIPSTMVYVKPQAPVAVPEPTTAIILLWSAALFYGYRKSLK